MASNRIVTVNTRIPPYSSSLYDLFELDLFSFSRHSLFKFMSCQLRRTQSITRDKKNPKFLEYIYNIGKHPRRVDGVSGI